MNMNRLSAAVAVLAAATALTACSSGGGGGGATTASGGGASNCTNTIPKKDLPVVTMWGWYPNMQLVVDNFNKQNAEVQVCWTNVGQGSDEYDKFQTSISAYTGAPDVIMIEMDRIPTFQIQNALVDIKKYGYDAAKANYSEGAWKDVSVGGAVYGVPVDGGPMAMIYRKDIFDKYHIKPPKTWAEYEEAAKKVKDAERPGVRRLRRERVGPHHGAADPEGRGPLRLRSGAAELHRRQAQRPGLQGRARLLGPHWRRTGWSARRTSSPPSTSPA